uniref:Porcupine O-acyltransferase like n=1 Tax=Oncorhynchus tshawytscha TaxID=74940 RepID=A0AAZ3P487_ONCTS
MDIRIEFFQELAESCVLPTSQQGVEQVWQLLLLCLLCRLLCRPGLLSSVKHLGSVAAGLYALYLFFEQSMVWVLLLSLLCYSALFLNRHFSSRRIFLSATILIYLLMGELHMINTMVWAMKGSSLAFDLDRSTVLAVPNSLEFTGYILFVGTVIFAPWVSYSSYKEAIERYKLTLAWLQMFSVSWVKCQVCLVISNCISYLVCFSPVCRWLHAYENAISFHFRNYFVGHLRESTTVLAGVGFTEDEDNVKWDLKVVKLLNVELLRSMVLVVTSWNIPCLADVLKNVLKLGTFPSIIVTYTASALLHGMSFHLGAVLLLSFHLLSVLRERLAAIFSPCILSKQCPTNCCHQHQKELWVYGINITFSAMAIFHLTYLGSLFDADIENLAAEEGYVANHSIQKWSELSWASHWLVFACRVFYRLIQ